MSESLGTDEINNQLSNVDSSTSSQVCDIHENSGKDGDKMCNIHDNSGEDSDKIIHRDLQNGEIECNNNIAPIESVVDLIKMTTIEPICITPLKLELGCEKEIERDDEKGVYYRRFSSESDLQPVIDLITKDLSEPYSIYTYRYFIYNWPHLCIMAFSTSNDSCIGAVVGKVESHSLSSSPRISSDRVRGYIAMLAVQEDFRRLQIGSRLVELVIETMVESGCHEVVLETEITNRAALSLYGKLGFLRDKRLFRYYLNGVDAFRLKLWLL